MLEGSDVQARAIVGVYHLLGAGGAARLPEVHDLTTDAAKLLQIRREIRELLLNHGGSVRSSRMPDLYLERYGKPLSVRKGMVDPQLRAMTRRENARRKTFAAFAAQHLDDVVELRPML
jgi:hypothetical protein